MIRLTPVLLIAALAGCVVPAPRDDAPPFPGAGQPPAVIPQQVAPFLPPGTPPSVILKDPAGCYLYSIEVTNPPSGFPVRDAAGRQVCEGQPVTLPAPPALTAQSVAPVPPAPVLPAPVLPALVPPAPVQLVPRTTPPPPAGVATGSTAGNATTATTGGTVIDGIAITDIPAPAPLPVPLPTPVE